MFFFLSWGSNRIHFCAPFFYLFTLFIYYNNCYFDFHGYTLHSVHTGQFTKKVFSDPADGFDIALVDCSTNFSPIYLHSVHFRTSTKSKPNHFSFYFFCLSSRKIVDPYGENTFSVKPPVLKLNKNVNWSYKFRSA